MKKLVVLFSVLFVTVFLFANSYRVFLGNECLDYWILQTEYNYSEEGNYIQNQNGTIGIEFSTRENRKGFSFDWGINLAKELPENLYFDIPQKSSGAPYYLVFYPDKYACFNTGISYEFSFYDFVGLYLGLGLEVRYGIGIQPGPNKEAGLFQQDFYGDIGLEILSFESNSIIIGCKFNVVSYMKMGIGGEDPFLVLSKSSGSLIPYLGVGFNSN